MRRTLFAAVGLSALLLTGCSGDEPEAASAPAPASSTAAADAAATEAPAEGGATADADAPAGAGAAGDAALSKDTDAICEQASRTSIAFGKTFAEDTRLLKKAAKQGGQAETEAEQKASRDVENFSYALLDMSKLAADAKVKKALATMGDEVDGLKGDLDKITDKRLAKLRATLDKACGRA